MKTVLITGSSHGLGKKLALVFAKNGYNIILHGRDKKALRKVRKKIRKYCVKCDVVIGDITLEGTITQLSKLSETRNLDVLINNAGTYEHSPFLDSCANNFKKIIDVNLIAVMELTHKIFPIFQQKRSGLIININSIAGKEGGDREYAYSASKHGLSGFSKSLQFDATQHNIRVMDIYLGAMDTHMIKERKLVGEPIMTSDVAHLIFDVSKDYKSMRITEIHLYRRIYSI